MPRRRKSSPILTDSSLQVSKTGCSPIWSQMLLCESAAGTIMVQLQMLLHSLFTSPALWLVWQVG